MCNASKAVEKKAHELLIITFSDANFESVHFENRSGESRSKLSIVGCSASAISATQRPVIGARLIPIIACPVETITFSQ